MMRTWYTPSFAAVRRVFISEELLHTKKQTKKKFSFSWIENLKVTAFKAKRNYTR